MTGNRRFGFVIVAACAIIYARGLWYGTEQRRWLVVAIVLLVITIAMPRILDPLKRLWFKLGGLLHVVISPVLLGVFYFGGLTPIGLVMQWLGKDPLRLKRGRDSYWIERKPPGPEPRTMTELF